MAPEVLTGKNTAADPAIDIYSMGVILFALVTGKLPFEGETDAVKH
jgi:serine/threonine protein kinase